MLRKPLRLTHHMAGIIHAIGIMGPCVVRATDLRPHALIRLQAEGAVYVNARGFASLLPYGEAIRPAADRFITRDRCWLDG